MQSALLRRLILTASSSKVLGNAVELLSTLNKEAADKGDFTDLIIISKDQFPEVCILDEVKICLTLILFLLLHLIL